MAHEALKFGRDVAAEDRVASYRDICAPRGGCKREALENDPGNWSYCPDCLTVCDDYGTPVNEIAAFATKH